MKIKWRLTLLWLVIALLVALAVVLPVLKPIWGKQILLVNILFVLCTILFARTIIQFKQSLLADNFIVRLIAFILLFPFIFLSIEQINTFQYLVDYDEINNWLATEVDPNQLRGVRSYFQSEFMLFGVGTVMTAVFLIFRMIGFTWKSLKKQVSA
jgi:prepilin signal peptidase PulO-like enzyme (type II secretory pathway)